MAWEGEGLIIDGMTINRLEATTILHKSKPVPLLDHLRGDYPSLASGKTQKRETVLQSCHLVARPSRVPDGICVETDGKREPKWGFLEKGDDAIQETKQCRSTFDPVSMFCETKFPCMNWPFPSHMTSRIIRARATSPSNN